MIFQNRQQAGRLLGEKLKGVKGIKGIKGKMGVVVLGIPRGGVVTAAQVVRILGAPLSVLIVKKIGAPGNEELAVGAMGVEGQPVWNWSLLSSLRLTPKDLVNQVKSAKLKVQSYSSKFKVKKIDLAGKTVIVVDDGIATGATAEAALLYLDTKIQRYKPACLPAIGHGRQGRDTKIILAAPVIAADTVEKLEPLADELVYLAAPTDFWAVGQFYREFEQVTDEKVVKLLK